MYPCVHQRYIKYINSISKLETAQKTQHKMRKKYVICSHNKILYSSKDLKN